MLEYVYFALEENMSGTLHQEGHTDMFSIPDIVLITQRKKRASSAIFFSFILKNPLTYLYCVQLLQPNNPQETMYDTLFVQVTGHLHLEIEPICRSSTNSSINVATVTAVIEAVIVLVEVAT